MNLFLLGIIVLLLIICIVLLIILLKRFDFSKENGKQVQTNKIKSVDIRKLRFPQKIEEMGHHELFQSCAKVFDSFKLLEYAKRSEIYQNNFEWHTWQISLLLSLIKRDVDFFFPNPKDLFHESISNKSIEKIKQEFDSILLKYQENVNISKSRDDLSKEILWSVKEVSIIFYYMFHIKEFRNL